MTTIFYLIVLTSIWNLAIEIVTSEGMALYNLRQWAGSKKSKWYEVIFLCVWCRPSIHSLVGYAAAVSIGIIDKFEWRLFVYYPFVVGGSSLVCGIIWGLYKLVEIRTKYYSHLEQHAYFDLKERKQNHFLNKKT